MGIKKTIGNFKRRARRVPKAVERLNRDTYFARHYYRSPIEEKMIFLESKQGVEVASNIFYTLLALQGDEFRDYDIVLSYAKDSKNQIRELLSRYEIERVRLVRRNSRRYLKALATAKFLFTDTSFPYYFVKRDEQVYTNTWHGTPLKHMGRDVVNRVYAMGNVKRNLVMADYLLYPNREMEEKMMKAYSVGQYSHGKVINSGYPRNSIFFDEARSEELRKELGFDGKQVVVYMPTWRGTLTRLSTEKQQNDVKLMFDAIERAFADDQLMLVRMHPLARADLDLSGYEHVVLFPEGYDPYDVLNTADVLVTDYSSVFFDFANSKRKIILYVYDREEYEEQRGLYYSLDDLPFPKVQTPEDLIAELAAPKSYDDSAFLERFCTYDCPDAGNNLVDYVVRGKGDSRVKAKPASYAYNGKPNDLFYVADLPKNGLTSSFLSLVRTSGIDDNVVVTFRPGKTLRRHPERIEQLPENVDVFPYPARRSCFTWAERLAWGVFRTLNREPKWVKKLLDRHFTREADRIFGGARIARAIQQTGYEPQIIGMFQRIRAPRAIFVHNDMVSEINTKGNHHWLTLKDAYESFDRVVCVTGDIVEPTLQIGECKDKVRVVNNFISFDDIRAKAEDEICFTAETKANVRESVLKELLSREGTIKFINIGRFSPEKGHVRLIDAFDEFYETHPDSLLVIIGGYGREWPKINQYIKTKKSRYHIILIRAIRNPYPILKRCDCFVFSSFYEALGLAIIEAQACGVPVVSTDVRGPRGFMREHGGYLVEDSQEGILRGMNDFIEGKVGMMDFNPDDYNASTAKSFKSLLDELR